jgi:hypothetical protein
MNTRFDRLEAQLRRLFENNLPKFFTGQQPEQSLVEQIVYLMRTNTFVDDKGRVFAPDHYVVCMPADDLIELLLHRDVLEEINQSILEIGTSLGFTFSKQPQIELMEQSKDSIGNIKITANFSSTFPPLSDTAAMTYDESKSGVTKLPENAELIIDGKITFPLHKPVIDIGRHSNNDLVLSSPHISRHHAQLRAIKNHFVIFDVGSTGGVFVNGRRISQATLHAGDVIRIGPVNLIFNQAPASTFQTMALSTDESFKDTGE